MRIRPLDFDIEWRRAHPFPWGRNGTTNPFVCHFGTSQHSTTETATNTPWAPQQPYLTQGFQMAGNLANQPPPQQQNPVVPMNGIQDQALQGMAGVAANGTPITGAANDFGTNLLSGDYLNSNPALGYFASLAGNNLGLDNPGAQTLQNLSNSNGSYFAPGSSTLNYLSRNNVGANNPGTSLLESLASSNPGTSVPGASTLGDLSKVNLGESNPGTDLLKSLSGTNYGSTGTGADVLRSLSGSNPGVANAGTGTLSKFANGGYFSNGYSDDTANSIMADVVPKIAAQFNRGNAINNPLAERSAAEGATAALAPLEYQNYQTQEGLAKDAASTLAGNTIAGAQTQGSFANLLQSLGLSGAQLQGQFGQNVAGDVLQGENQQGTFANLAASLGLTGAQLQGSFGQDIAGNTISGANTSSDAASKLAANFLTGRSQQLGAASDLSQGAISGGGLQATAAQGISTPYQDTIAKMVQSQALAPQTQALNYSDLGQLFNVGNAYQTQAQNEASGQAASYNFSQMSPYQQLQAYMDAVTGVDSQSTATTKPYFQNDTANTLGTVSGIASTAAMLLPFM